jgi:hypothetical protein
MEFFLIHIQTLHSFEIQQMSHHLKKLELQELSQYSD